MAELFVRIQSHNYVCRIQTPMARQIVEKFAKRFVQYGTERRGYQYVHAALKIFASVTKNDMLEYRFHANTLSEFKKFVESMHVGPNFVEYTVIPLPQALRVEFTARPYKLSDVEEKGAEAEPLVLFDYQEKAVAYNLAGESPQSKLIGIQTGKGKGMVTMFTMVAIAERPLVLVEPRFVTKWVDEFVDILEIEPADIMVVRSTKHLQALVQLAIDDNLDHTKIIVMNNTIFRNWIKAYEFNRDLSLEMGYGCFPDGFMELIRAGFRIIDEVHRDFWLNFMIDLHTHINRSLSLSATLENKDGFLEKMYDVAYPTFQRYMGMAYDRYANVTAVMYRFNEPEKIRYKDVLSGNYSHNLFEQQIIKRPDVLANYLKVIDQRLQLRYLKHYQPTEKAIIFAASIDLCTIITDFLKRKYPHLDIRRYVENDPYENVLDADIRVTTIGSGGTAIDIKNLVYALMTTSISSVQANLQALGRLRKLKTDKTPEFDYLVNADNPKQMEYHEDKVQLLTTRALNLHMTHMQQFL